MVSIKQAVQEKYKPVLAGRRQSMNRSDALRHGPNPVKHSSEKELARERRQDSTQTRRRSMARASSRQAVDAEQ